MAFSAIVDWLLPGSGERVAAALAPVPDIMSFVDGDLLLRVVQHATEAPDVPELLAARPDVLAVQKRLAPYLAAGASDVDGSGGRLDRSYAAAMFGLGLMRRVQQRVVRHTPDASLAALRYRIRPGFTDEIAEIFTRVRPEPRPVLRDGAGVQQGLLHGVAVFVKGDLMVRVVSFDGALSDVARYMADRPGRPEIERQLSPYLVDTDAGAGPEEFLRGFAARVMRPAGARPPEPTGPGRGH